MKRLRVSLEDIASHQNLYLALWKAKKGKESRQEVRLFLDNVESNIARLSHEILQGVSPKGDFRSFYINDPKRRLIHAACFEDRLLHHAIMNIAAPVFEKTMVDSSYACRVGKGVHRAVADVQRKLQRYPWYVKTDISGYFPHIDHAILFHLLQKRFKGDDFLHLIWRVIKSFRSDEQLSTGLPIGSLTSQYFANYYFDGADRFLLESSSATAHVRYMDDVIFWCRTKEQAKETLACFKQYLWERRALVIKPNAQVNRSSHGVSFCGFRVQQNKILLNRRKKKRFLALRKQYETAWLNGEIDEMSLQQRFVSLYAVSLHADSQEWRKFSLEVCPSLYE